MSLSNAKSLQAEMDKLTSRGVAVSATAEFITHFNRTLQQAKEQFPKDDTISKLEPAAAGETDAGAMLLRLGQLISSMEDLMPKNRYVVGKMS